MNFLKYFILFNSIIAMIFMLINHDLEWGFLGIFSFLVFMYTDESK